jgi:methylmalonyl-CoA mutase
MAASPDRLDLAAEFPSADEPQWLALVAAGLGATGDPVAALTSQTYEGIGIRPLYADWDGEPGVPGSPPYIRGATADGATLTGWDVRTRIAEPDARATRSVALEELEHGATSLWLVCDAAGSVVGELAAALDGVYLDLAPVVIDAGAATVAASRAFLALVARRRLGPAQLRASLGADPIGLAARTGTDADAVDLAALTALARPFPELCIATVDATAYHDAGASDADEIGIATAVGVGYLRALTDAGLDVDEALLRLEFRFAVTADQFASITKLRAARQVWGRVAQLCEPAAGLRGQRQHAVTSAAMLTCRDPWVNMLRATIACFAGAVGGADAITVLPFDTAVGRPDKFGRRIARNTQTILHDESGLGRVVDAAGGSWYVENRTAQLAEKAWDAFTAIERAGGAAAALASGYLAQRVAATRDARADDIAHRRAPITGVSEFALPDEAPLTRDPAPVPPSAGPLPPARWAEPFERMRDEVERRDPRPTVFLAALGPFAAHGRRVDFARNVFGAGGFRVVVGEASDFPDSGAQVACLCGLDDAYRAEAARAADALRSAGARLIWLAGSPEVDGVDDVITANSDVLEVLRRTAEVTG